MLNTNNGWISVDDALPPNNKGVLLFLKVTEDAFYRNFHAGRGEIKNLIIIGDCSLENYPDHCISHWMPLPKFPD